MYACKWWGDYLGHSKLFRLNINFIVPASLLTCTYCIIMFQIRHICTFYYFIVSDHDHLAERFNLFRRYITLTSCNFLSLRAPNPLLYQSSSWRNATRFRSNQSHKIHLSLWLFRSGYVSTYSNVQFDAK